MRISFERPAILTAIIILVALAGALLLKPSQGQTQQQGQCVASPSTFNPDCDVTAGEPKLPVPADGSAYKVCLDATIVNNPNFSTLQSGISHMVSTWNEARLENGDGPHFQLEAGSTTDCKVTVKGGPADGERSARWDFSEPANPGAGGTITVDSPEAEG